MGGSSSGNLDDAGLLEWLDRRRLASEMRRQVAVGMTIFLPVLLGVVGILSNQMVLIIVAAGVFSAGLLSWMVFGFVAWRRAVDLCDAVEAAVSLGTGGTGEVPVLKPGDRIGSMVAEEAEEGLVLSEQIGATWLQAQRLTVLVFGVLAALGAVAVGASILGSGSVGMVKGWVGLILMGLFAVSVVIWLLASCRARTVRVGFEEGGRVVRVTAIGLLRRHERVVSVGSGSLVDTTHREVLRACTLDLRSADGWVELVRVALPREGRDRHSTRARRCVLALCEFRAARLDRTIKSHRQPNAC